MTIPRTPKAYSDDIQQHLNEVRALLQRQTLVATLVKRQDMPRHALVEELLHKQHQTALQQTLDHLHPADVAYILEALPPDERDTVWEMVKTENSGMVLLELSDAVRESLIEKMAPENLTTAAQNLAPDELADLAADLPEHIISNVTLSLDHTSREQLYTALSYPENTVGALMDFDTVTVREDISLEVVLRYLRQFDALPVHSDKIFVIDRHQHLRGILSTEQLLVNAPDAMVANIMRDHDIVYFNVLDAADEAAQAFERYNLLSAPVVDERQKLIGRLTVEAIIDFTRAGTAQETLNNAGLREDEDIFAPLWVSVKNRWAWLALNMLTAIMASRVIGLFEHAIEQLVALAALMPIVAGIGGNSGNQTTTMIVRALAIKKIEYSAVFRLLRKELSVALINGLIWGTLLGIVTWLVYRTIALSSVIALAMTLNLLLAASAGVLIPMLREKFGRDPALGGAVMLTALTDSGGFLIFLGLANFFLL